MLRLPAISRPTRTTVSNRFARKASRISRVVASVPASSSVGGQLAEGGADLRELGDGGAARPARSGRRSRSRPMVSCRSSIGASTVACSRRRRRTVIARRRRRAARGSWPRPRPAPRSACQRLGAPVADRGGADQVLDAVGVEQGLALEQEPGQRAVGALRGGELLAAASLAQVCHCCRASSMPSTRSVTSGLLADVVQQGCDTAPRLAFLRPSVVGRQEDAGRRWPASRAARSPGRASPRGRRGPRGRARRSWPAAAG